MKFKKGRSHAKSRNDYWESWEPAQYLLENIQKYSLLVLRSVDKKKSVVLAECRILELQI
jgi:hypothetical protein